MSEGLRTAVLEGLRAFAEEEPDFAMSHGMRARAADFILAQPRPAPKADSGPGDNTDCGHPNPIWFADNDLWNAVMGGEGATDDPGGILCPTCFMLKAGGTLRVSRPAPKADGLVEELERLHQAAKGRTFDLTPADGPIAKLTLFMHENGEAILAALKGRDVVLEEAAERAAFVDGYRAAHMVPDAYDSTSAAEEAWEGYRLVSRNLKERV